MGQAKQRGTFAERQAAAIHRNKMVDQVALELKAAKRKAYREWLDSLDPADRQAVLDREQSQRDKALRMRELLLGGMVAKGNGPWPPFP